MQKWETRTLWLWSQSWRHQQIHMHMALSMSLRRRLSLKALEKSHLASCSLTKMSVILGFPVSATVKRGCVVNYAVEGAPPQLCMFVTNLYFYTPRCGLVFWFRKRKRALWNGALYFDSILWNARLVNLFSAEIMNASIADYWITFCRFHLGVCLSVVQ